MKYPALLAACISLLAWSLVSPRPAAAAANLALPWVAAEAQVPRVAFRTFKSEAVGDNVSYHVYLPPAYDEPGVRLPVLYWLHGTGGGIGGIGPTARLFGEAMESGHIPAMIIVWVNGLPRSLWANSKDGSAPVETVFVSDVIPDVDRNFRTIARREGRILEGFSMGGYGAARIGLKHPHLFGGISILAGGPLDLELRGPRAMRNPRLREAILRDVCGNDPTYFEAISPWMIAEAAATDLRGKDIAIRHVVGDRDDTAPLNRQFHGRMAALDIIHDYVEIPGVGHDARALLDALGEGNGRFYRRALGHPRPH